MDITLTITLNQQTGQLNVSGPIDNKLLAYGMLALAHDVIAQRPVQTSPLVAARMAPLPPSNGKAV